MCNTQNRKTEPEENLSRKPPIGHVEMEGGNGPEHEQRKKGYTIKDAGTPDAHSKNSK